MFFLMTAFPTHVWTIILALHDFSWMKKRNNSWDAIGVGAYGLLIAFAESVFVFFVALLLSFLIPRRWKENRRMALLFVTIFTIAFWAIINQLYFIFGISLPGGIVHFLANSVHPLRIIYGVCLAVVTISVVLPLYAVIQFDKVVKAITMIMERLSILMILYLVLDVAGFIIVLVRNF